jgi:TolB-like protein
VRHRRTGDRRRPPSCRPRSAAEDWQRLLLRIYARHRSREAAQAHARAFVELLRKDVGAEPAPETQALIAEIERGAISNVPWGGEGRIVTKRIEVRTAARQPLANKLLRPRYGKPSIAVLPAMVIGGGPVRHHFAEGLHVEIITALSRTGVLAVAARDSTLLYASRMVDPRRIGRELEVDYLLNGTIREAGERVRIAVELIDAANGLQIWADQFEGKMQDGFDLQDLISTGVVTAVAPKIEFAEIERMKHRSVTSQDAYELYLRSLKLTYEFTKESFAEASRHIEQALLMDPSNAALMALGAYCHAERSTQGWAQDSETEAAHGLGLATRAIKIAKYEDANVFWMTAYAILRLQQDAHLAREIAHRSIRLNRNSVMALAVAGRIEHSLENNDVALELLGLAQRRGRLDPRRWFVATGLANAHMSAGRFEQALDAAKAALRQNPRSAVALRVAAASLAMLGRQAQAADAMRDLLIIDPHLTAAKLDAQRTYVKGHWWTEFLSALQLAGLPK